MADFAGKVALVTGGASGMGRETALAFAREGAKVVVADVQVDGGEETVAMIRKAGGEAIFVKADVSKTAQVKALIDKTVETYGRLDCAFNNAAVEEENCLMADCTEEAFDRMVAINLKGVWLCLKYEIQQMLKQGGGVIVNTASIQGIVGHAFLTAYTGTKHGVVGLTKSAALGYAKAGIRVNAVCPGPFRTPMLQRYIESKPGAEERVISTIPLGRIGEPREMAEAVLWLCSDRCSFITGHPLVVDGGLVAW